ncbi:disintegrin and metalloproteinase domain-containing protein [Plakobranchus ocellatus]|uniref:Disintegrin and metalloproteinase domain-containing protein n=1 Tax=Plakobranchus ocellatus TaxID=259542 RepID=A0AAV4BX56_9GAST|nr:disintegrin and metalloproteinase domain-containing protein [Plakobranchus ocellatus]
MAALYKTIIFLLLLQTCIGNIHDLLSYHEVIYASNTHIRDKRSVHDASMIGKREFHFTAFNKTLHCHLKPRTDLLSKDFKLNVYGAEGEPPREEFLPRDQVFVGRCDGDAKSEIRGVFNNGVFTGTVVYDGERYAIEDAKLHMPPEASKTSGSPEAEEKMIVYRASDINWAEGQNPDEHEPSFCGNSFHNPNRVIDHNGEKIVVDQVHHFHTGARNKRASQPSWNTCKIIAVADYKFYQEMGSRSTTGTALYILEVIDQVDKIYRSTVFSTNGGVTGLGFEIGAMDIYTVPTRGFNRDTGTWDSLALLQAFSAKSSYREYCAAHLFTHQSFEGNILGLAYISPATSGGVGGICSPAARVNGVLSSLNTGWSSTRNAQGENVLVQQANLVTAHGHNWGSEHDPESGGCAPSSVFGNGKYLMYPYSVSGYDSNNNKFSTCSRETISRVLDVKGSSCFGAKEYDETTLCGNGQINRENEETCDAGLLGRFNLDRCCTSYCSLIEAAVCSPTNYECCTSNCQAASRGTFLGHISRHKGLEHLEMTGKIEGKRSRGRQRITCIESLKSRGIGKGSNNSFNKLAENRFERRNMIASVYSRQDTQRRRWYRVPQGTGDDLTCPPAEFKNDTTKCLDEGECRSGVCVPFCESKNLISCACDEVEESCFRCCRSSPGARCRPYDSVSLLPDGRPCVGGSCVAGQCEKSTSTTIQRLFTILENLTVDGVVKFFKNNIVGTVMVFSLVIWIPLCLLISYKDRHKRKGLERSENIESRMDRALVYDEDKRKVVPTQPAAFRQEVTTSPRYRNVNFTDLGGFGSDT